MEAIDAFATTYPLDILIAAEHPDERVVTGNLLSGLGYNPEMATSSGDVLRMIRTCKYDVILLDIDMPGLEKLLSAAFPGPSVCPITIIMSGSARPDFKETCLRAMVDHYITRPIQPAELLLQLKACSVLAGKCCIRGMVM